MYIIFCLLGVLQGKFLRKKRASIPGNAKLYALCVSCCYRIGYWSHLHRCASSQVCISFESRSFLDRLMYTDFEKMVDIGGRLWVSLIGHSFIRRLRDFMSHNTVNHNLRLDNGQYQVSCLARGGLTITWLSSLRQFTSFPLLPDLVFLHIVCYDLVCSTPNISKLVQDIMDYAQYLSYGCGVKRVIIGQFLDMILATPPLPSTLMFWPYITSWHLHIPVPINLTFLSRNTLDLGLQWTSWQRMVYIFGLTSTGNILWSISKMYYLLFCMFLKISRWEYAFHNFLRSVCPDPYSSIQSAFISCMMVKSLHILFCILTIFSYSDSFYVVRTVQLF